MVALSGKCSDRRLTSSINDSLCASVATEGSQVVKTIAYVASVATVGSQVLQTLAYVQV